MKQKLIIFGILNLLTPDLRSQDVNSTHEVDYKSVDLQNDLKASAKVAQDWLKFVDAGQYSQSWYASSQLFQKVEPNQIEWIKFLDSQRKALGALKMRILKKQEPAWNPKGLPEGEYMVIYFDSSFANKSNVTELLTLIKEASGWKVLTYQINPKQ